MIWCTWLQLVNLGMIWCFGFFFFLEILDDCDEESQQRHEALASLDDVGRKLGSAPTARIDEGSSSISSLKIVKLSRLIYRHKDVLKKNTLHSLFRDVIEGSIFFVQFR